MIAAERQRWSTMDSGLPCALDNRPLKFEEWEKKINQVVYVSATPGDYELDLTGGEIVEQLIRPTGLLDPYIEVSPARGQVTHLLEQIRERVNRDDRVLVTALTKRLAEDLSGYLCEQNVRCRWLHSELDAFERVELLKDLREGVFDVLVGVNLLREGLDLPEVSLVAILDADKEGFLRSETSLIQTIGRSARNVDAKVILYADRITDSMKSAIEETERRRSIQEAFNKKHGIVPKTVKRKIKSGIQADAEARQAVSEAVTTGDQEHDAEYIEELRSEMLAAAENMEFERAAAIRDRLSELEDGEDLKGKKKARSVSGNQRRGRKKGRRGTSSRIPKPKKR